jgi:hypothetical protein
MVDAKAMAAATQDEEHHLAALVAGLLAEARTMAGGSV